MEKSAWLFERYAILFFFLFRFHFVLYDVKLMFYCIFKTLDTPSIKAIAQSYVLLSLGDSVSTDHISVAGSIPKNTPAARYLTAKGSVEFEFLISPCLLHLNSSTSSSPCHLLCAPCPLFIIAGFYFLLQSHLHSCV